MTKCCVCGKGAVVSMKLKFLEQDSIHDYIGMEGKIFTQKLCQKCKKTVNPKVARIISVKAIGGN